MMREIWHFEWKDGHYLEWTDGKRTHLKFLTQEEYSEVMFEIECL